MSSSVQSSQPAPRSSPARGLPSGGSRPPSQDGSQGGAHDTAATPGPSPPGLSRHKPGLGPDAASTPGSARGDEAGSDARTRKIREPAAPPLVPTLRHSPLHCCRRRRRHRFRSLRRNSARRAPIASPLPASARGDDARGRSPPPARVRADPARGRYVTSGPRFQRWLPLPPRSSHRRVPGRGARLPSLPGSRPCPARLPAPLGTLPTFVVSKGHRDGEENGRQAST